MLVEGEPTVLCEDCFGRVNPDPLQQMGQPKTWWPTVGQVIIILTVYYECRLLL